MSSFGSIPYNIDINQPGASDLPRFSINQPTPYQDALVEDIILGKPHPEYLVDGSNLGMARVRFIPDDRNIPVEQLNWALPLDATIREYPLKNEMVVVYYSAGRLFYTRRVNTTNSVTESSVPGLSQIIGQNQNEQTKANSQAAQIAAQGGPSYVPGSPEKKFSLGEEFSVNPNTRMVKPFEGDLIIPGRFGNIIRFGSSLFSNPSKKPPQPNLLLTVGQAAKKPTETTITGSLYALVMEDINNDKSCIWMVTDEKVGLDPATREVKSHLRSTEFPSDSTKYTGAQIFINSDRVILNSKVNEISLFAKAEINLSAVESITIDSAKSVLVSAVNQIKLVSDKDVLIKGKRIQLVSTEDISYSTTANYIISGQKIFIGSGGEETQPMVLGGELAKWLRTLIQALSFDLVRVFTTFDPQPFANKMVRLSEDVGLPGTPVGGEFVSFNSTSNFTSKTNS